ncbi:MAG: 4a-hydroxytetrahydrobiopterin dehydratase [Deltaproteobacteria bacterium]|nr:4a-hydroxytetrahydrobiopterin dehydratase [Deltaproteobacteria bacterium]
MAKVLNSEEVDTGLAQLKGWVLRGNEIEKRYEFNDFREAIAFVNAVADEAEKVDHHPDITINYNKVLLALSTHNAGGLTEKDFGLARDIDFI